MNDIRCCLREDLYTLQQLSKEAFRETFAHLNTEANMNAYLEEAFNLEKLEREMLSETSGFYFIYSGNKLAGYLKLNECGIQTEINDPMSVEIERIYVLRDYQGLGIGNALMEYAISTAKEKKKSYIWLGVWEKNANALAFYAKNGFYKFDTHTFMMGDEAQNDYLLRKDL